MKFWYFLVCSFSISSKNEKFPKSFQYNLYFLGYCANSLGIFRALKSEYFLGFSKNVSDEHTYHFYIKSAPPLVIMDPKFYNEKMMEELGKTDTYKLRDGNIDHKIRSKLISFTNKYKKQPNYQRYKIPNRL